MTATVKSLAEHKAEHVLDDLLLNVAFMFGIMGQQHLQKAIEALRKQGEAEAAANICRHAIAIQAQLQILMEGENAHRKTSIR